MICTFCGTENPQGNRFCGICGVRLERRNADRRTQQRENTNCAECGHVNEARYKFCGMCGAKVDQRVGERRGSDETARATAIANAQLPQPESRRPGLRREPAMAKAGTATLVAPPPAHRERPQPLAYESSSGVSGPSFLGLNEPDTSTEYLLEEERSSHRGVRAFLLLVVLAAIVGLIFVQYRSSMKSSPRSPEMPNPGPATVPKAQGDNRPARESKTVQVATAARSLQAGVTAVVEAANSSSPLVDAALVSPKKGAGKDDPADDPVAEKKADSRADPPAARDDQPSPALIKAQQYLHGQGVRQNCEQGLVYLRAAARENDPQAAVQMGALYSSGLCVAPDKVKAYEWFSSARELEPDNHWIAKNLNDLWGQMTQQERQQIHR